MATQHRPRGDSRPAGFPGPRAAHGPARAVVLGDLALDVFLMGDAASASKAGQQTPNGYYNTEKMLISVLRKGGTVKVCGTCMDARGLAESDLVTGATRSTMDELSALTMATDKVLVF